MIRLLVGLVLIAAGLSGRWRFVFTDSPLPLLGVGGLLVVLGAVQLLRRKSDQGDGIS